MTRGGVLAPVFPEDESQEVLEKAPVSLTPEEIEDLDRRAAERGKSRQWVMRHLFAWGRTHAQLPKAEEPKQVTFRLPPVELAEVSKEAKEKGQSRDFALGYYIRQGMDQLRREEQLVGPKKKKGQ